MRCHTVVYSSRQRSRQNTSTYVTNANRYWYPCSPSYFGSGYYRLSSGDLCLCTTQVRGSNFLGSTPKTPDFSRGTMNPK